ncbi:MAG: alpha-galactosidase, partial [Anaerolineae bacterium]
MSHAIGGTPTWSEPDRVAVVRYRIGERTKILELEEPNHTRHFEGLQFVWRWRDEEGGQRMWVRLTHGGESPIRLDAIDVLAAPLSALGVPHQAWSLYQNGWQSWSPAFARHLGDGLYATPGTADYQCKHQPHWQKGHERVISSEWVSVLSAREAKGGAALLIGFVTAEDQLAEIRVAEDGSELTARCYFDGVKLDPGDSIGSETLVVRSGRDPLALLEWWAGEMGREMKARVPDKPPTGWCSWYTYYGENTAEDVEGNVAAIKEHKLPLDVVLIDDGYQTAIGDWFSADMDRFPNGMEAVISGIRGAGHCAGIWTAPFGAAIDSQLFAEHPDWVLRDGDDEPAVGWVHAGSTCYALDCTHPEVLRWLRETFRRMRREWEASFFKIDFLFAATCPGRRHDPTATRAQALRRGVGAIRDAIGDRAFLLACGAPLGPCVGLVDGMRIGPDVDPNWHPVWRHDLASVSAENALRNVVTRAPLHGRLWANDPDCLLVRQRGDDMGLVLNEMRTLASLVALTGGPTLDSDELSTISVGRLKYLRQTLPPTGMSARPLDLFEREMPRLFTLQVDRNWGRWWIAGIINWGDHTTETTVRLADLDLPAGRYHLFHYWRRRYLGVTGDIVTIRRHQPHETAVLLFKPVSDRPDLLTTTFHVCQGAVEISGYEFELIDARSKVKVRIEKAGRQFGRVFFTVPRGWRVVEASVDGRRQA